MEETKDVMLARMAVQEAAAANPAVAANMARHAAALNVLLLGRNGRDARNSDPIIQSGFELMEGDLRMMMATAARVDKDIVHLMFDVEPASAPIGVIVVKVEGEAVACHPRCALWMPAGGGRAVLVSLHESQPCHFLVRREQPLIKVDGWPAPSIEAGRLRASTALLKLAGSAELKDAHIGANVGVVGFDGPRSWTYRADRIAA